MPHVAGPALEKGLHLALEQRWIEIAGNRELACGLLELKT